MPSSFTPIAAGLKPPAEISLSEMINTARGAQDYRQTQQINPLALRQQQAETDVAEQTAPSKISASKSTADTAETTSRSAAMDLQNKKTKAIASGYIGMINDPMIVDAEKDPSKVNPYQLAKAIEKWGMTQGKNAGVDDAKTQELIQPYIDIAMKEPGRLRDYLKSRHIAGLDSAAQQSALTPSGIAINEGSGGRVINTNPFTGKQGAAIEGTEYKLKLGPNQRMTDTGTVDANNNPIFNVMDENGRVVGQTTVPTTVSSSMLPGGNRQPTAPAAAAPAAASAAPTAAPNAIVRIPAGQSAASGQQYLDESNVARASAVPAKNALTNIDVALKYLPLANVGKYSEAIAGLQSLGGNIAGSKPEELAAAARDIIQKTMVDLSLQKNAALGGKFAADLAGAQNSLADAGKNPTAIISSLNQLRPLLQHAYNYTQGLDKAIEKSPSKQYIKPQFDAAMNVAYDPLALQWKNAADTGGRDGALKFAKDNKINVKDQAKMLKKLEGYKMLVNGDLAGYQQSILRGD